MALVVVLVVIGVLTLIGVSLSLRIVKQYEQGVVFRLGRVVGVRQPGLIRIVPIIDVIRRVSLRVVTMPIESQGIITRDNVSVALAETDRVNASIRQILDGATEDWGVLVTLVELKDIQLPATMQRAMARQAEAEREKRAKIIAAEGERLAADALGEASDVMVAHPLALQLRNLQTLMEIGADKNTTVVFPAPLMSTIQELGTFLAQETRAVATRRAGTGLRGA
jgi:regulator of protease activity HflC (stomatin/prohibitin superfamily)